MSLDLDPTDSPTAVRVTSVPGERPAHVDVVREVLETVVFVVLLVAVVKGFVLEWFVIPTGSMSTTLLGYHLRAKCPQCGHEYRVNSSQEVDPADGPALRVDWSRCENCGLVVPMQ
jgi:hypothetical protein